MQRIFNLQFPSLSHQALSNTNANILPTGQLTGDSEGRESNFSSCSPTASIPQAPSPSNASSCFTYSSNSADTSDVSEREGESSLESSTYLTPPDKRSASLRPPHKPHRKNSVSLTMYNPKISRRNRVRRDSQRTRRRHRQKSNMEMMREKERRPYWWLPGCKVTTTAPRGFADDGNFISEETDMGSWLRKSIHVTIDAHDGRPPRNMALTSPPPMTRRFSSA